MSGTPFHYPAASAPDRAPASAPGRARLALASAFRRPRSPTPSPRLSPRVRTPLPGRPGLCPLPSRSAPLSLSVWTPCFPEEVDSLPSPRVLYDHGVIVAAHELGRCIGEAARAANSRLAAFEWPAGERPDFHFKLSTRLPDGLLLAPLLRCPWLWVWLPGSPEPLAVEGLVRAAIASARGSLDPAAVRFRPSA